MRRLVLHSVLAWLACATCSFGQTRTCLYSSGVESNHYRVHDDGSTLYVPVVVHIVYDQPELITQEQVYAQLNVLNNDFSKSNQDLDHVVKPFQKVATSANIQFYLDQEIGDGGILRVSSSAGPFGISDIHFSSTGGSDKIPGVLNVWVCDLVGSISAFAKTPESFDHEEVGMVIDHTFFGTSGTATVPYDGGRTLTHEVGHWLGLAHPWKSDGCGDGDQVADTPPQYGPAHGCDLSRSTCESLDMVQNFMNLAPDDCMHFFTAGQVERMRQTLLTLRPELEVAYETLLHQPQSLTIYPNPAIHSFFIDEDPGGMQIVDASGRKILFESRQLPKGWQVTPLTCETLLYIKMAEKGVAQKLILKH